MPTLPWLDAFAQRTVGPIARRWRSRLWLSQEFLARVSGLAITYQRLKEPDVQPTADRLRTALARQGLTDALVAESFALVREVAARLLDQRHFDVQVAGGMRYCRDWWPRCTPARENAYGHASGLYRRVGGFAGAHRDGQRLSGDAGRRADGTDLSRTGPVGGGDRAWVDARSPLPSLCLRRHLLHEQGVGVRLSQRSPGRRSAVHQHSAAASKVASSDPGGGLLLRGLYYAIVDEADSVLVDEARTPSSSPGVGMTRRNNWCTGRRWR